jgi:hypothetical protein
MIVFIVGLSVVSATLLTVPQLLEQIRVSVECLRSGQRFDVLLYRKKVTKIARVFPDHRFEIS